MSAQELETAAAGRLAELRPLTRDEVTEQETYQRAVSEALRSGRLDSAPRPNKIVVGGQVLAGLEHGIGDAGTLCGVPRDEVFLMRHLFSPKDPFACPACAELLLEMRRTRGGAE